MSRPAPRTDRCTCDEPGGCVGTCEWARSGQYRAEPTPPTDIPYDAWLAAQGIDPDTGES